MNVTHQPGQNRFVKIIGKDEAVLEYEMPQEGVIDFCRTFVPEAMRGMGVAGQLVEAGVKWARSEGFAIKASCSYAHKWLERDKT